ncbi:MAG: Omp28-related outer membrane protein [Saprospiraceae bacterium]|nr:Omp28-related outer membrane protein [Saprospiraceae bacterium]
MRKLYLFSLLLLPLIADAQYAKYELVEWFTNTYCPICASRNPSLRTVYNEYEGQKLHRITIHPSVPYPQCPLYNFNKEDNGARQAYYGVSGTPTLFINGVRSSSSASVFESDVQSQLDQSSPVALVVTEVNAGSRQAHVTIKVDGAVPDGDYRLFVAILEESVDLVANNGETEHLDVLRKFITSNEGDAFDMPAAGAEVTKSYSVDLPSGVDPTKAYVIAFIQDISSKLILNSGTKFDEVITGLHDVSVESEMQLFPNPARDVLNLSVNSEFKVHKVTIFNHLGQNVLSRSLLVPENNVALNVENLPSGTYSLIADLAGDKKASVQFVRE